jgi:putative transposase
LFEGNSSMRHHSQVEIGTKLRQAQQLMARGQTQAQACKELGVSVMTYHRWRKLHHAKHHRDPVGTETDMPNGGSSVSRSEFVHQKSIDEVRTENERLRRIATDLLIEKMKAEEQFASIFRGKSFNRS